MIPLKPIQVKVSRIIDGDTIIISTGERLRANYVDAPEVNYGKYSTDVNIIEHWQWGNIAREFLTKLIVKPLIVIPSGQDTYGRWLSDWYLDKITNKNNIQLAIARQGLCAYYQPWQRYDFSQRELSLYLNIMRHSIIARQKRLGYWSVPNPILPSEVRIRFN